MRAWQANGWIAFGDENTFNNAKKNPLLAGNYLIHKRLRATSLCAYSLTHHWGCSYDCGMPVDLGLPGDIDITEIENQGYWTSYPQLQGSRVAWPPIKGMSTSGILTLHRLIGFAPL